MKSALEGLLFIVGNDGITLDEIKDVLQISKGDAKNLLDELSNDYNSLERGI